MPDLTTKLYFGPWYRRSPYFEATRRAGCKAYDIYNKMCPSAEYDDVPSSTGAAGGCHAVGRRGRADGAGERARRRQVITC
jgi:hypothetical protein